MAQFPTGDYRPNSVFNTNGSGTIGVDTNAAGWTAGAAIHSTADAGHHWSSGTSGRYEINEINPGHNTVIGANGQIALKGDSADIDINGKSLNVWMEKVEERLNILTPNPELEQDWDELRRLGERYRSLEKKCKEKANMWNKLKSMPKPVSKF